MAVTSKQIIAWVFMALMLTACNGGSGRLTGDAAAVAEDSESRIEADESADVTDVLGDSSSPTLEILSSDEGVAIASLSQGFIEFATSKSSPLLEIIAMAEQFKATAIPDTVMDSSDSITRRLSGNCSAGGSIVYTSPPLEKENLVAGDEVTLSFQDCAGTRMLLDGSYAIKVDSGATMSGEYATSLVYTNYSADSHDGATALDVSGTIRTAVDTTVVPERYMQSSPLLNLTLNGATAEVSAYDGTIERDVVARTASYEANYDLRVTIPDYNSAGLLKVSISPPYVTSLLDKNFTNPGSGSMSVTGANGASVLLESATAMPETLLLNVNGVEQVLYWSEL